MEQNKARLAQEEDAFRRQKLEDGQFQKHHLDEVANRKNNIRQVQLDEEKRLREQNENALNLEHDYYDNQKRNAQDGLKSDLLKQINERNKSAEKVRHNQIDEGDNMKKYWDQQNALCSEQENLERMTKLKEAQENAADRDQYVKNRLTEERERKRIEREERLRMEEGYMNEQDYLNAQKRL